MRIAIASLGDPSSERTWSGIPSSIMFELRKKGHEVIPIALDKPEEPWHFRWRRTVHHRLHKKWFLGSVEKQWLEKISRQLDDKVNKVSPNVVLVIHADWLAYATFHCPAFIIHDTTFASIVDYYPCFTNLCDGSLKSGHEMYQRALDKCAAAIYPAQWATQSAIDKYNFPASKVFTIPFGGNIKECPPQEQVERWIQQRLTSETCNLVFIGTQWERKGGPEVLQFLKTLKSLGVKATLTVIGCAAQIPADLQEFVTQLGYLRKEDPADAERLMNVMSQSHALIVLSQAECYGCVYCEANAYGLPAIGRDTGGVPEIINDGMNGLLLKQGESVDALADRWAVIWYNLDAYKAISLNAYSEYCGRLSYGVFADRLDNVLTSIVPTT
jgi:glycosyltransferase involved in cell wall biosynthesis